MRHRGRERCGEKDERVHEMRRCGEKVYGSAE
ncbi:hypothetical protein A2U01_0055613, partial [Trifolium medium]|nr:hypothetical protein [Trifolium medium]